ncbi:taurine catabolism dioxygenase TauD [Streptomyces sp. C10-9-1]|uniref:guanitoxin biosynthesis L-enduracididine beta-hydroxylase GntD n=1 Tax=Streptomyces sp. C10-9-1 TaxID=1859285 RepID=UPI002111FBBC|nr:guanitoxin biosynthesis L-enduracididine beta-hydroxylase GntD [Streptomyces sp. C10-9-1]MCQ6555760.1 taurine catabolism dioxygenase TauD [Streptomyces sp. C10-9-1]
MSEYQGIPSYDLSAGETASLEQLLADPGLAGLDPGEVAFHDSAWELVARVPTGLRRFLEEFRLNDSAAAFLVRGFGVDDDAVGPTPRTWAEAAASGRTRREELFLGLLGNCLGSVFSWPTLQSGRLIQNVLPIAGEEDQQSGHGSDVLLEWHTEDAFHPYRCDYLALFGVRNHDRVPTTLASIRDVRLSAEARAVLSEPRFYILPDDEHLRQLAAVRPDDPGLLRVREMRDNPEPVAVLFGGSDSPYLRIDPFFMRCVDGDAEAEVALKELVVELERTQQDVVVDAGTLLVVDNYLAVHGRRAFTARYDGTDRWLQKAVVTRDLRKSRAARESAAGRLVV